MSNFTAEIRPRTRPHTQTQYNAPQGFVAEIRPRCRDSIVPDIEQDACCDMASPQTLDHCDQDLLELLSHRDFSKESITKLLNNSIISLVEQFLIGKCIAKIEGQVVIDLCQDKTPIVVNLKKVCSKHLNANYDYLTDIDSSLNVKVRERDSPPSEFSELSCDGNFSPPRFNRDFVEDERESVSSAPSQLSPDSQRRRDSDEESGYTSNGKEDSDPSDDKTSKLSVPSPVSEKTVSSAFSDFYSTDFDGGDAMYQPEYSFKADSSSAEGSDEMDDADDDDDDDDEFNSPLIIDENRKEDEEESTAVAMNVDEDQSKLPKTIEKDQIVCVPARAHPECSSDETEDMDSPVSSDITDLDTDAPVDLSGNSEKSGDIVSSAVPHPQSIVSKHPKGHMCKQCSQVVPDAQAVSKHALKCHGIFACTYCFRAFTAKNNLKRHVRLHTGLRPFKCTQCTQSFARRDDLKAHVLRHDYSKPFRCSVCRKGYTDRACVKNHMAKEHGSRLMHVCPQCGESFDMEEAFTAHKKSHPELKQFSCKTCSFIGTNHLMTLKHSLLHEHKLFSCKPCNAYFADPFDYTSHVRKHKKNTSFTHYTCCFCDMTFATYDQYVRHEYSHAQGKTHTCKVCKKQFRNKSLLHDHALTHNEVPQNKQAVQAKAPAVEEIKSTNQHAAKQLDKTEVTQDVRAPPMITISPVEVEQPPASCDEYSGQLLDLSMKKPRRSSFDASYSCDRQLNGLTGPSVPRNGCAPEFNGMRSEQGCRREETSGARRCRDAEDLREKTYMPYFDVRERSDVENSGLNMTWRSQSPDGPAPRFVTGTESARALGGNLLQPKPVYPNRPRSVERNRVPSGPSADVAFQRRPLNRSHSSGQKNRAALRYSPYTREKMSDLAAKFLQARCSEITVPKSPLKTILPTNVKEQVVRRERALENPSYPVMMAMRQSDVNKNGGFRNPAPVYCRDAVDQELEAYIPRVVSDLPRKDSAGQRSLDVSDPETALGRHMSTVVKTEPGLDRDGMMINKTAAVSSAIPNFSFRSVKPEAFDLNSSIASYKSIPTPANNIPSNVHAPSATASSSSNKNNNSGNGNNNSNNTSGNLSCDLCKMEFGCFNDLEAHSVEMHKRYLCEHCFKSFTARPNRDRHVRYHTGERPYKCDLCDSAFFRGDDLKYHRTTRHPTAQPFVCTRCSASFTWGRDLERHIRHSKCKAGEE